MREPIRDEINHMEPIWVVRWSANLAGKSLAAKKLKVVTHKLMHKVT